MHHMVDLPKFLWMESVQHTVWLKNQTSMCALDRKTPYEILHKMKPDLTDLPEWGARIFALKEDCRKLESRQTKADGWGIAMKERGTGSTGLENVVSLSMQHYL